MKFFFLLLVILLATFSARANICGTDYQNFNPTTSGLGFVTVQSSETLKPCLINAGLFLNYAVNSLTYTETLNANYPKGQKRKDQILGADLSLGLGLTKRWDVGLSVPVVLSQSVQDDYYVASFDQNGATELKANTKFRFIGDTSGGLAGIISINKNLISDNPFAGKNPGLTWNFEFAADTIFYENWVGAVNIGYRKRNPGEAIAGIPFIPMQDQYIYSIASSYRFASLDTKLIFEIYGSQTAKPIDQDTDRSMNSLEALAGVKHNFDQNVAAHIGATRQIDLSLGGAEWRIYTGLNWALGPICKDAPILVSEEPKLAAVEVVAPRAPEVLKIDMGLVFKINSDKIEPEYIKALAISFKKIVERGYKKIQIDGHTDSTGSEEYNQRLSEKRSNAIRQYLIEKFKIDEASIVARGYGSKKPISENTNYQGRKKNRRVELSIW